MSQASAAPSLLADATRAARLRFWIVIVGVLVIVAFAGTSAYDSWRSYGHVIDANSRELSNLAKTLAEQAADTLQTADLLLRNTVTWYEADRPTPGRCRGRQAGQSSGRPVAGARAQDHRRATGYHAFNHDSCRGIRPSCPIARISSLSGTIRISASF